MGVQDEIKPFQDDGVDNGCDYDSPSEVFAYASKLVEQDLAAAVRIFRQPKRQPADVATAQEAVTA